MEKITDYINDEELVVNGEVTGDCMHDCKHKVSWVLPGMQDYGCKIEYTSWITPER